VPILVTLPLLMACPGYLSRQVQISFRNLPRSGATRTWPVKSPTKN